MLCIRKSMSGIKYRSENGNSERQNREKDWLFPIVYTHIGSLEFSREKKRMVVHMQNVVMRTISLSNHFESIVVQCSICASLDGMPSPDFIKLANALWIRWKTPTISTRSQLNSRRRFVASYLEYYVPACHRPFERKAVDCRHRERPKSIAYVDRKAETGASYWTQHVRNNTQWCRP